MSTPPVEQGNTSAGRVIRLRVDAGSPHSLRPNGPEDLLVGSAVLTEPDIVTSPMRADGQLPATGVMFMLQEVITHSRTVYKPAQPLDAALGFHVVVWLRNPVTGHWGATGAIDVRFGEWFRSFDFNGGDLFFQVTGEDGAAADPLYGAPGTYLDLHLVEL